MGDHEPRASSAFAGPPTGGGEMGALMRSLDWSRTPLGPVDAWPQSLRTALGILLTSRHPIFIWWGPELIQFYNDAYRPILGATKHPRAMGQRGRDCWIEIWDVIAPMIEAVMQRGESTFIEDGLLCLDRNGYLEECYFTYAYSPIRDESGGVGGIFVACSETTGRILGERRLRTLTDLGAGAAEERTAEDACSDAARTLGANRHDLPFAATYLRDADGTSARLAGASGLEAGGPAAPASIDLRAPSAGAAWPIAEVLRTGEAIRVGGLGARLGRLPGGPWPEPASAALVLPIMRPGRDEPAGALVAGLSPRRALDDAYRAFLDLVAGHVATAVANARAYAEERRRAEALAELDRAKTAFFSNVSHEFRTPLALMLGPLEDALQRPGRPPEDQARLEVVHRNGLRLLELVNTLLDFSRIEAGRIEAVYEPTDLAAYTAELASVFRSAVERAGLALVVDCPPLPEPACVDRAMWEKITLNLLSNALKFTFEGQIAVSLRQRGDRIALEVRDTGVGIPAAEVPRVFERFHQVRGTRARTHEGTGIGLALVQELVKLHGGAVRVESAVESGTTFTIEIPAGKAHLPADRIGQLRQTEPAALSAAPYVEEALRWLPRADERPGPSGRRPERGAEAIPAAGPPPVAGAGSARILFADDNADMRDYVRRLLAERWTVEVRPDGAAALAAALERPPDLVLADAMMPGLDGFGLLAALRADGRTREVPVILVSARAGEESRVEGLAAGADDYLVKPFSARELIARVEARLELSRMRAEGARRERAARAEAEAARAELQEVNEALEATNRALQRRVAELQTLLDLIPIGIAVADDPECRRMTGNPALERMLGMPPGSNLSKSASPEQVLPFRLYRDGRELSADELPLQTTAARGTAVSNVELDLVWPDGTTRALLEWAAPFFDEAGKVRGGCLAVVDITDQKGVEAALRESQSRFEAFMDHLPAAAYLKDQAGRYRYVNRLWQRVTGWSLVDALGRTDRDLFPGDVGVEWRANDRAVLEQRRTLETEETVRLADGVRRFLTFNFPVVDVAGRALAGGISIDVTERRRAEEAQRFLTEAGQLLSSSLDYQTTLGAVTRLAVPALGDWCFVDLLESGRTRRAAVAHADPSQAILAERLAAFSPDPDSRYPIAVALRNGRAQMAPEVTDAWLAGLAADANHLDDLRAVGPRSWITVPLWVRGSVLGTLTLISAGSGRRYDDKDVALAGELGRSVAVAIDNARLYRQAQDAVRAREMFLARASHELRTPLTSALGSIRLLKHVVAGRRTEAPDDLLEMASRNMAAILALLNDLLDASKLAAGEAPLALEPVELAEVVLASKEMAEPQAREKGVAVHSSVPAGLTLDADPLKLVQVLSNLLVNAVKFTPAGGEVVVEAELGNGDVLIRVRDTGDGIDPEHLERIFEPFFQVRRAERRRQRGTGLGLAICRQIVTLHGGRIWAESAGAGRGTTFTVRLPRAAEQGRAA